MGTTARSEIRQLVSEDDGDFYESTTSSAGGASGETIIDTATQDLTEVDDGIQGWYILTSGSNSGDIRRIKATSGYTQSSGTITPTRAHSAQIATSVTYEIHSIDPVDKHVAINRALEQCFSLGLYLPIRDETLIVNDHLANSDFETFSGGFNSWTEVGSPTVTQETTIVFHGSQSAKVVASGAAGQLTQAPTINISEVTGKSVFFWRWVYATAVSTARVRLDWDGSAFDNSEYHSGNDQWELLKAEGSVPNSATQVKVICEVADGGTAYFAGPGGLMIPDYRGNIVRYTMPTSIIALHSVLMQQNEDHIDDYIRIPKTIGPVSGRFLRLIGRNYLTRPATDSAFTEVDGPRLSVVVAKALEILYRLRAGKTLDADEKRDLLAQAVQWQQEAADRASQPGVRMDPMGADDPTDRFSIEEDSSGKYLVFKRVRGA
mgnify:CR=1 FL=1